MERTLRKGINGDVVLSLGSEGGSLNIVQASTGFYTVVDEGSLLDFYDDDVDPRDFYAERGPYPRFGDALAAVDRYTWHCLYPILVHADVAQDVLHALHQRYRSEPPNRRKRVMFWMRVFDDMGMTVESQRIARLL